MESDNNFDQNIYSGYCDKCNELVPKNNCLAELSLCFDQINPWCVGPPRHFLPTDICEGSPSRAQYIEGQQRDKRGYEYEINAESKYRKAYSELQKKYIERMNNHVHEAKKI